ncbi:hypothetical protein LY76DRAFT_591796 [Colletotrichum caudatum]|nr:hypothetical protein LY76DRAFT_591796 [Colletotrichum caudatum]
MPSLPHTSPLKHAFRCHHKRCVAPQLRQHAGRTSLDNEGEPHADTQQLAHSTLHPPLEPSHRLECPCLASPRQATCCTSIARSEMLPPSAPSDPPLLNFNRISSSTLLDGAWKTYPSTNSQLRTGSPTGKGATELSCINKAPRMLYARR